MTTTSSTTDRSAARLALETGLVAAATLATWFAWLGTDAKAWTGRELVGCLVTLGVVILGARLAGAEPLSSSAALAVAFLAPVTWELSRPTPGDFNFWPIAIAMLAFAVVAGCAVISLAVAWVRRRLA